MRQYFIHANFGWNYLNEDNNSVTETTKPETTETTETTKTTKTPETTKGIQSCADSEFGCCYDNETDATGPNGEGCPCSISRFGCCPDGVTTGTYNIIKHSKVIKEINCVSMQQFYFYFYK